MIAADMHMHIHQTACLHKCNRIISNLIASPSFGCIYVIARTLNPAVPRTQQEAPRSETLVAGLELVLAILQPETMTVRLA